MKQTSTSARLVAFLLAILTLTSAFPITIFAGSIGDGSRTAHMTLGSRKYYLTTTAGTRMGASSYTYTTNDGLTGPAYCINHVRP